MDRCALCGAELPGCDGEEWYCAECESLLLTIPDSETDALGDYYWRQALLLAATEKLIADVQVRYLGGVQ